MKHYLTLQQRNFYITSGVSQDDNVIEVLEPLTESDLKKVYGEAHKTKIAVRRNPVLKLLLGRILLKCNQILNKV